MAMSCILRIAGGALDIDALLAGHALRPDRTWKEGETRMRKGLLHSDSGATFVASDRDLHEFDDQVREATTFLERHGSAVATMVSFSGVQTAVLDFAVGLHEGFFSHSCCLPPPLIQLAANAGVGLEISCYACSSEEGM